MALSSDNLRRALRKGPIVLEGTFSIEMPREKWVPPPPLPRIDPMKLLLVMLGYFAALTMFLRAIGFLY